MNIYGVVILAAILCRYFLELFARRLNIKSLDPRLPAEMEGLYDREKYAKSQDYARVRTRFDLVESTFGMLLLLVFWFSGGFNWLDQTVRAWEWGSLWTGVAYIGILSLAATIISLPFDVYSTFVIEERFGFNRTTPRTFILDRLKGLLLMAALGLPVLLIILWFFQTAGPYAWLYCWLAVAVFGLIVQFIAPIWIMPLFNKFTPLPEGDLKQAIDQYAESVRFAFRDVFVIDGSRRSTKANAFFTGFGKNKRIALYDTLLADNNVPEVVSVLAHEIGHYKKKHILLMMLISLLHTGILFFLLSLFITNEGLFAAFYMEEMSVYAGLMFFGILYEPISFLLGIAMNGLSRKNELEADQYAVQTTEDREAIVSALKKLSVKNLSNLTPHPFYVWLHYSHPPLLRRISEIRASPSAPLRLGLLK